MSLGGTKDAPRMKLSTASYLKIDLIALGRTADLSEPLPSDQCADSLQDYCEWSALGVHCLLSLQQMHWAVWEDGSEQALVHYPPLPLSSLWLHRVAHSHFRRSLTPTDHNKTRGIIRRKYYEYNTPEYFQFSWLKLSVSTRSQLAALPTENGHREKRSTA